MRRDWGITAYLVEWRPDWSIPLFDVLSLPGDLVLIIPVLAIVGLADLWRGLHASEETAPLVSARTGTLVGVILGGLALIVALEAVIDAPRPPPAWQAIEPSPYGFPSGHTMAATITWGAIAWWSWDGPPRLRVLTVLVIASVVAVSRLVLGVHYLPDVLVGIVLGAVYVIACDRIVLDRPWWAFGLGVAIAVIAVAVSGGSTRAWVALLGTTGGAIGWWVIQQPAVRRGVRAILGRRR